MTDLFVSGNNLTDLDISQNPVLDRLFSNNNQLQSLNIQNGNNTNFQNLEAQNNANLTCVQVDDIAYANNNWLDPSSGFLFDSQVFFSQNCGGLVNIPDPNFEPGYKLEDVFMLMSVARKIYEKSNLSEEEKTLELSRIYRMAFKQFLNTYTTQPLNKRTQNVFNNIVEKLIETETLSIDDISHIENVENRLAWEKFTQSRNVVQLPVVDSLEQIEFTLRKQLMNARRNRAEKDKDSLIALLQDFKTDLKKKYPTISNFTQESFEITEFQKNIKKEEVVLKYMFFKDQFAVFEITQENINWGLKAWSSQEEKLLYDHLSALNKASSDLKSKDDMLSRILIPESVSNYSKLTIIPDRSIYFLPFETLIFKNNYLLKSHAIRYSSHLRFTFFNKIQSIKMTKLKQLFLPPNMLLNQLN